MNPEDVIIQKAVFNSVNSEVVVSKILTTIMGYFDDNLKDIIAAGISEYMKSQTPKSDELTLRQAYKNFGEGWVKRMIKENRINKVRQGQSLNSKFRLSRAELHKVKSLQLKNPHKFYSKK